MPSPNIDSDSSGHSDVVGRTATTPDEEITPLRGPESIPRQVAAALSADVTTLNPESAQDDVSSDIV